MTPSQIIAAVESAWSVPTGAITGPFKIQRTAEARFMAAWLMRIGLGMPFQLITNAINRTDHGTALMLWSIPRRRECDSGPCGMIYGITFAGTIYRKWRHYTADTDAEPIGKDRGRRSLASHNVHAVRDGRCLRIYPQRRR